LGENLAITDRTLRERRLTFCQPADPHTPSARVLTDSPQLSFFDSWNTLLSASKYMAHDQCRNGQCRQRAVYISQRLHTFLRSLIVTFATQRLRHQISHPASRHELYINLRHLRTTGRSYFGLADATDAGSLEIRWPSGERETTKLLPEVDRIHAVT
jgi:hypothetical protein